MSPANPKEKPMPSQQRVRDFIDTVVSGEHVRAIEDFYHPDASMQENGLPPRVGRDVLVAHEKQVLTRVKQMHTHDVRTFLVDGDNVVVNWTFDAIGHDGSVRRLEEVALQHWRGDRIATERFFYDTATAFQPVEAKAG
jgi:ketosteroid isomerase-like protein